MLNRVRGHISPVDTTGQLLQLTGRAQFAHHLTPVILLILFLARTVTPSLAESGFTQETELSW